LEIGHPLARRRRLARQQQGEVDQARRQLAVVAEGVADIGTAAGRIRHGGSVTPNIGGGGLERPPPMLSTSLRVWTGFALAPSLAARWPTMSSSAIRRRTRPSPTRRARSWSSAASAAGSPRATYCRAPAGPARSSTPST